MSVLVNCSCGQRLSVPEQAIGKVVRCPKCDKKLLVPAPSAPGRNESPPQGGAPAQSKDKAHSVPYAAPSHDPLLDELGLKPPSGGMECPECHGELPANAVLCIHCGYSFQLGRKLPVLGLESSKVRQADETPKSEVDKILNFAERELANEPIRQDMGYGSPTSAWLIFAIMLLVAAAVIAGGVAFFNYMEGSGGDKDGKKSGVVPRSSVVQHLWV